MGMRAVRTEEEIQAQLEARYRELEAEGRQQDTSCVKCRWVHSFQAGWCLNPLIKGYGDGVHMGLGNSDRGKSIPPLCGPEKALWRPKLTLWQRLYNWFVDPFGWEKF